MNEESQETTYQEQTAPSPATPAPDVTPPGSDRVQRQVGGEESPDFTPDPHGPDQDDQQTDESSALPGDLDEGSFEGDIGDRNG